VVVFSREKTEGKVKSSPPFNDDTHDVVRWHRGRSGNGAEDEKRGRKRSGQGHG